MCGIVGYVGKKQALPILMTGLKSLEYRGYDSSGIAIVDSDKGQAHISFVKESGKLSRLQEKLRAFKPKGVLGIGHTRWATHGEPSERNAHPHLDGSKKFAIVHNGIIENYSELKKELIRSGHRFLSETDSEVICHLIQAHYKGDVFEALQRAVRRLSGYFALALVSSHEPDHLYVFKRANPLVIGIGKDANYVASDAPAILPYTKKVVYLEDDQVAKISADKVLIYPLGSNRPIRKRVHEIKWNIEQAAKDGYAHFMLKEIHEQPKVVAENLKTRIKKGRIVFDTIKPAVEKRLKAIERVHFVSCGTAYHAGLVGSYMIGDCARVPVRASVSSEFRYEDPVVGKKDLVIFITQSGETADTLAALREAKSKGAFTLAIVNVIGSTIARESDALIYTLGGPEIGVASTKAYSAQLTVLALFSIYFALLRKRLSDSEGRQLLRHIQRLPVQIETILKQEGKILKVARALHKYKNFLYIGRGYNYPNALEGALKLKEISYAHAHGYAAGEMKHGPIALIDKDQPVICLVPEAKTYEKMLSNIEEIKARKGIVFSIATRGSAAVEHLSRYSFLIPEAKEFFSPILTVIPLQLFAYHVARLNKRDVDQPRNLAKSVTVE